ncbi:MAG: hypothetical protein FWG48_04590, partial [Oscillospiraceae bacterium]|nr:hypothetical protein [Oscillospiraceae bacterium]
TKSKAYRKLGKLGADTAHAVSGYFDQDASVSGFVTKELMLGQWWICVRKTFSVRIYPSTWLIWAYTRNLTVNSTSLSGNKQTTQSSSIMLHFYDGKKIEAPERQFTANGLLDMISQRYPHVLFGYRVDLISLFKSDMRAFMQQVAYIKSTQQTTS